MAWQPLVKLWDRSEGATGNSQFVVNPDVTKDTNQIWHNDTYQVLVRFCYPKGWDEPGGDKRPVVRHLSIHRHDRHAVHDWRHLQQIKNEVVGEDAYGMELYPPEARLVDTANEYHLWVWPPGFDFGFGLSEGLVSDDDMVDEFNEGRIEGKHKGRQRPWEEGLTTGRSPASDEGRARAKEEFSGGRHTRSSRSKDS